MEKIEFEKFLRVEIKKKKDAESYIGKRIMYLRDCDIDKSGRGYFFPKLIEVHSLVGGEFSDEDMTRTVPYKSIKRILVLDDILPAEESPQKQQRPRNPKAPRPPFTQRPYATPATGPRVVYSPLDTTATAPTLDSSQHCSQRCV